MLLAINLLVELFPVFKSQHAPEKKKINSMKLTEVSCPCGSPRRRMGERHAREALPPRYCGSAKQGSWEESSGANGEVGAHGLPKHNVLSLTGNGNSLRTGWKI